MGVLILVLMDDALVPIKETRAFTQEEVLILVLMDDALVHLSKAQLVTLCKEGLNPCFNG